MLIERLHDYTLHILLGSSFVRETNKHLKAVFSGTSPLYSLKFCTCLSFFKSYSLHQTLADSHMEHMMDQCVSSHPCRSNLLCQRLNLAQLTHQRVI